MLELPWLPEWGWSLSLRLDDLGALYAVLAVGVAVPVFAYGGAYRRRAERGDGSARLEGGSEPSGG